MKCRLIILFCFVLLCGQKLSSQPYGLGFSSHEIVQDKRTGLDLSPNKALCLDHSFELRFDLSFFAGRPDYFGYIFRIIQEGKQNVDLIYDQRHSEKHNFKLVIGDKSTRISFKLRPEQLFEQWHTIRIRFDLDKEELLVWVAGQTLKEKIDLTSGCYKFLFGANNFKEFRVTDTPPMKLRNVVLKEDSGNVYFWPLDGVDEVFAEDIRNGQQAVVTNPLWVRKMHRDWELATALSIKGSASVMFDTLSNTLLVVGEDSLYRYNTSSKS